MPPTFHGAQDDWLDDIGAPSRRPNSSKKAAASAARLLPPEQTNATVIELFPNQSSVRLDGAKASRLCGYKMSTLAFGAARRERSPVCVGDRVRVETGAIVGRSDRRNRIVRPAPNARDPVLHVLAANIDFLVVVAAVRQPEFSAGIVDRFLVAASTQKIVPILCVNKIDLLEPGALKSWTHYPQAGITLIEACAKNDDGIDSLRQRLRGKTSVFCGHSGVGKTSLLRRLLEDKNYGRTGDISLATDKGRHTTTGAVLLAGPEGASYIDTPGITNFGLLDVTRETLLGHFPELFAAAARCASACAHDQEPACALRPLPRYASYRQILLRCSP